MTERSRTLSFLKRKQKSDENLLIYEEDDWKFEDEEEEQTIPNVNFIFHHFWFLLLNKMLVKNSVTFFLSQKKPKFQVLLISRLVSSFKILGG